MAPTKSRKLGKKDFIEDNVNVFKQDTEPSSAASKEGDLWFDGGNDRWKILRSGTWGVIGLDSIEELGDVYKQSSEPANPNLDDIWIDTDEDEIKIWGGSSWIQISGDILDTGTITAIGGQFTAFNDIVSVNDTVSEDEDFDLSLTPDSTNLFSNFHVSPLFFENIINESSTFEKGEDVHFKPDGTKMYLLGTANPVNPTGFLEEFNLSTAWDETTRTQENTVDLSSEFNFSSEPSGMHWKPDGTKLFIWNLQNNGSVAELHASTPWDISSLTFPKDEFDTSSETSSGRGIHWKPDGTKFWTVGSSADSIFEYNVSSAWDIRTASLNQFEDIDGTEQLPTAVRLADNGTRMIVSGKDTGEVHQWTLGTGYDISTETFDGSLDVSSEDAQPNSVAFGDSGNKLYVLGGGGESVYEYNLSTAYDVLSASFNQSFNVSGLGLNAYNGLQLNSSGTEMYVSGRETNGVYQFGLSTAWDISTATSSQSETENFDGISVPKGLFLRDDGNFLSTIDDGMAYQYVLTTTEDITTLGRNPFVTSPDISLDVEGGPWVGEGGSRMYITDGNVQQFDINSSWDIAYSEWVRQLDLSTFDVDQDDGQDTVFVNSGDTFVVTAIDSSTGEDPIFAEYALSTTWDISSATLKNTFDISGELQDPGGLFVSEDVNKVWVFGEEGTNAGHLANYAFGAYSFNWDYSHRYNPAQDIIQLEIIVNWDIDPGDGNELDLRWKLTKE